MIDSIKHGESQASVPCDSGMAKSAIHGWLKEENKLCNFLHKLDSTDQMKRKKAHSCQRPRTWQDGTSVVCEGEADHHPN